MSNDKCCFYCNGDCASPYTETKKCIGKEQCTQAPCTGEVVEDFSRANNTQIGGDHYTKLQIQPMEYSFRNHLDCLQHTIIKYVTRFRDKGGEEDLLKARHCIDMLIQFEYHDKD